MGNLLQGTPMSELDHIRFRLDKRWVKKLDIGQNQIWMKDNNVVLKYNGQWFKDVEPVTHVETEEFAECEFV